MLRGGLQRGHNAVIVVVRVGVDFGEPHHFLGEHRLAVDDGGHLPVGAAGVEADAAAVQVAADGLGVAALLGHLVAGDDLKGVLVHVGHVVPVEGLAAGGGIVDVHPVRQLLAPGQIHPEAAVHPQHGLDDPFHIIFVGGGKGGIAVHLHVPHRHLAVGAFHGHVQGLVRPGQESAVELGQRNKAGVQLGDILHRNFNAEMIHVGCPPFHSIEVTDAGKTRGGRKKFPVFCNSSQKVPSIHTISLSVFRKMSSIF